MYVYVVHIQINGLMESWLIRRRGGKPMEKGSMNMMRTCATLYCAFVLSRTLQVIR